MGGLARIPGTARRSGVPAPAVGLDDDAHVAEQEVDRPDAELDLRLGAREGKVAAELQEPQLEDGLDRAGLDRIGQQHLQASSPSPPRPRQHRLGEDDGPQMVQHLSLVECSRQLVGRQHAGEIDERAHQRRARHAEAHDDLIGVERRFVDGDPGAALPAGGAGHVNRAAARHHDAPVLGRADVAQHAVRRQGRRPAASDRLGPDRPERVDADVHAHEVSVADEHVDLASCEARGKQLLAREQPVLARGERGGGSKRVSSPHMGE